MKTDNYMEPALMLDLMGTIMKNTQLCNDNRMNGIQILGCEFFKCCCVRKLSRRPGLCTLPQRHVQISEPVRLV